MKKSLQWMLATILTICGTTMLASCSDSDNDDNGGGGDTASKGDVVLMYYGIGGANLDDDTEEALGRFAVEQAKGTGVRGFVQYKYSAKRSSQWNLAYEPSGEYGSVYRFELNSNSLNPQFTGKITEGKAFAGSGFTKFADSSFKMYDPDNLVQFVNWCMQQAPDAKAYVLAFGDHGGAYNIENDFDKSLLTRGVMYDDNLDDNPCMTPTEIRAALDKLTRKPDMIFFDCCLMNNLEVLGELQGGTNYVFASGHAVFQSPLDELCKSLRSVSQASDVNEGIRTHMGAYVKTITDMMEKDLKNKTGKRIMRSMDYTLTDMSKMPALLASIKNATDFLTKADITGIDVDQFNDAASGCYQYVDNRPLFDVLGYLNQLKEKVFNGNSEYANLVSAVQTAANACHVAHDEFSYDKDEGTNRKYGLTYSVTLGFSSSRFIFEENVKQYAPQEPQGVIMYVVKAGKGTAESPYYNDYMLENGDNFLAAWVEGVQEMNFRNINRYWSNGSGSHLSWDKTYRTLQFDKTTGWSNWMKKNPGIHYDNPPYDDIYDYVFEDPDLDEYN